ncbi:hypothetical protein RGT18_15570 [Solobacterium moorei]|nr:hypothetical protein RGT18_15570 [Solobacterium moorei]
MIKFNFHTLEVEFNFSLEANNRFRKFRNIVWKINKNSNMMLAEANQRNGGNIAVS